MKFLSIIMVTFFGLSAVFASPTVINKKIILDGNEVDFAANAVNSKDRNFGYATVDLTNPTINGLPFGFDSSDDDEYIQLKSKICIALGFSRADGLGTASEPAKYNLSIGSSGSIVIRSQNLGYIDWLPCRGSL